MHVSKPKYQIKSNNVPARVGAQNLLPYIFVLLFFTRYFATGRQYQYFLPHKKLNRFIVIVINDLFVIWWVSLQIILA